MNKNIIPVLIGIIAILLAAIAFKVFNVTEFFSQEDEQPVADVAPFDPKSLIYKFSEIIKKNDVDAFDEVFAPQLAIYHASTNRMLADVKEKTKRNYLSKWFVRKDSVVAVTEDIATPNRFNYVKYYQIVNLKKLSSSLSYYITGFYDVDTVNQRITSMKDVETKRLKSSETPFNTPSPSELVHVCDVTQNKLKISGVSYGFGANGTGEVTYEAGSWRQYESVLMNGMRDGYELEIDFTDKNFLNSCVLQFAGNGRILLLSDNQVLQEISNCVVNPKVSVQNMNLNNYPFSRFSNGQSLGTSDDQNGKLLWATDQNTLQLPFGGLGSNALLAMSADGSISLQVMSDGIDGAIYTFGAR